MNKDRRKAEILSQVNAGKMTIRQGATLLGMDYWSFRKLMVEHTIPAVTCYTVDEFEQDRQTLDQLVPHKDGDDRCQ